MEQRKKQRGDRKDAYRIRDLDAMHAFMPYLLPNRTDNEAVMNETVDIGAINKYLEVKNEDNPEFRYTMFHVICAAIAKTVALRPKMNYFYAGHRLYERKDISLSFVVKKQLTDSGAEALAIIRVDRDGDSPIEQIYGKVKKFVYSVRKEDKTDGTNDKLGVLTKLPRPILRFAIRILNWLDYHGWVPAELSKDDPYYSTVFVSNLGSIKMSANYHHLINYGTNSFFVIIGEKRKQPFFRDDGTYELRETAELGMTIDERIADGSYYAKSVRILKKILENPELLEFPIDREVEL